MRMRPLDRKLLREMRALRAQMLSIGLVVACGVMTVVALRGTYEALAEALERYYREHRFADVFLLLERAPEHLAERVRQLPGVAEVQTRVQRLVTLDVPGLDEPALGLMLSIPPRPSQTLNAVHLVSGRHPDPQRTDEVLLSENFARANALQPGSELGALIEGSWRTLRVVGVALSPDYIGEAPPGSMFPDDRRFGILRMNREVLAPAVGLEGAFNDLSVTLAPGASAARLKLELDRLFEPYGGRGAHGKDEQPSHVAVTGELRQNRVSGTTLPAIFLGVAAFLLNIVLGRLVGTQRAEIGVLKAFGYTDAQVGQHYLSFALAAAGLGAAVGVALGAWAGAELTAVYGRFFRFPDLHYRLRPLLAGVGAGVSILAAVSGALGAVRRAVRLPPAEAMRPEQPAHFRPGPLERLGLGRLLSASGRLIIRNVERRPLRSLASWLGVAMGVLLMMSVLAIYDSIAWMNHLQFERIQREDLSVGFVDPRPVAVRYELGRLTGVRRVEVFRTVAARVSHGPRERTVSITGLPPASRLRVVVDAEGRSRPVPPSGVLVNSTLAERLGVVPGDLLHIAALEGQRPERGVPVVGTVDEPFGLSVYMDLGQLNAFMGEAPLASGALLTVEPSKLDELNRLLKQLPAVSSVFSPRVLRRTFEKQLNDSLLVSIGVLVILAAVLTVGIVYNGARISLAERGRELASLRVLGFTRREVAGLLLGEQAVLSVAALPLGWALGMGLLVLLLPAFATDQFRMPLEVTARTLALSGGVALAAAALAAWGVRRRLWQLDLVEVLKTRE